MQYFSWIVIYFSISGVTADLAMMKNIWEKHFVNQTTEGSGVEGSGMEGSGSRFRGQALDNSVINLSMLDGYGCWCYLGAATRAMDKGRGPPVDEYDQMCKNLEEGYTCVEMDHSLDVTSTGTCDPQTVVYAYNVFSLTDEAIKAECETANSAPCEQRVCMLEVTFVRNIMVAVMDPEVFYTLENSHNNVFDPKTDCPIKVGVKSDKACCGAYPNRFPYKTMDGLRSCCVNKTYNPSFHNCCPGIGITNDLCP